MGDLLFALGQALCLMGLLYGAILTFANWNESGRFWGDFDPILPHERHALTRAQNVEVAALADELEPEIAVSPANG